MWDTKTASDVKVLRLQKESFLLLWPNYALAKVDRNLANYVSLDAVGPRRDFLRVARSLHFRLLIPISRCLARFVTFRNITLFENRSANMAVCEVCVKNIYIYIYMCNVHMHGEYSSEWLSWDYVYLMRKSSDQLINHIVHILMVWLISDLSCFFLNYYVFTVKVQLSKILNIHNYRWIRSKINVLVLITIRLCINLVNNYP